MCKNMTIYELMEYLEEHAPATIYFNTDEQKWSDTADSLKLKITFNRIVVTQHPKLVYFTNGVTQLHINQIRRIDISTVSKAYPGLGNILRITSADRYGNDIVYEFLLS